MWAAGDFSMTMKKLFLRCPAGTAGNFYGMSCETHRKMRKSGYSASLSPKHGIFTFRIKRKSDSLPPYPVWRGMTGWRLCSEKKKSLPERQRGGALPQKRNGWGRFIMKFMASILIRTTEGNGKKYGYITLCSVYGHFYHNKRPAMSFRFIIESLSKGDLQKMFYTPT